jgi:universal stress protein A
MEDIKKILAVSWMTQSHRNSFRYAASLAEKYGAELSVIHVIDDVWTQSNNLPAVSQTVEQQRDAVRINKALDLIINSETKGNLKVNKIIKVGDPVKEVLKFVKEDKIDLVILRAHEESRIERFLVRSHNDELIRKMPCSILLVKSELEAKTKDED